MVKPRSVVSDPNHVPQKKGKIIKELPNGRLLPKEMQKLVSSGLIEVKEDSLHNDLVDVMEKIDEKDGPMFKHNNLELYWFLKTIMIIDHETNQVFITKDSDTTELRKTYWESLR